MKRWILIVAACAVVAGFITWRLFQKSSDAKAQAQARASAAKSPPPVTVAPVTARDIVQTYVGVGSASAPLNVKIAPKVSGRLDYLQLREGDSVKHGQVIAKIDPSQIEAQISQQQATIAEAEYRLAQARLTQSPTNVNVTTQIQQQAAALASARADENQTRQNYASQVAAAQAAVTDAQGRIDTANATIENANAGIRSAQANVNNAQVRYNRTYDLYKQGFVAAQDVDDARTTLKVQQEAEDVSRGLLRSAQAARDSAVAQKSSAQKNADIVAVKGKADIAAATAKVTQARAALVYARSNTAQKPAYEQNLAALSATVNANRAQLRNLKSQYSDTILTSPVDGYVTARYVDPGAIVSPSQPVIGVSSFHNVFVDVSVPEEVSNRLHVGQSGNIVFDAMPGRAFAGNISQITPAADPTSRQFPVRLTLDNRTNLIKPGMFARVTLVTQRVPGALVVPREAVQRGKAGGSTVVVVDPKGVAERRNVETGAEDATGIQIREGVRQNELVVILTSSPIKDGQKVRVSNSGGPGVSPTGDSSGGGAGHARGDAAGSSGPGGGAPMVSQTGNDAQSPGAVGPGASSASGSVRNSTPRGGGAQSGAEVSQGSLQSTSSAERTSASSTTPVSPGLSSGLQNRPPNIPMPSAGSVPGSSTASGGAPTTGGAGAQSATSPAAASGASGASGGR